MSTLICDIVTPESKLFSEEAYMVVVPGVEGEMGFLFNHESLISALTDGVVRVQREKDGDMLNFVTQGGYVEVTGAKVIVLPDRACSSLDVKIDEAREKLSACEEKLEKLSEEEAAKTTLASDIAWYQAQIRAAETEEL